MPAWLIWIVAAAALAGAESLSGDLVLIMLAGGAGAASVSAAVGAPVVVQVGVAILASIALLAGVRPFAKTHFAIANPLVSGTDGLIGREATVVEPVDANGGRIKVGGQIWSARTQDRFAEYSEGLVVRIAGIDGATAVVSFDVPPIEYQ